MKLSTFLIKKDVWQQREKIMEYRLGCNISKENQRICLNRFIHRFTGEHMPRWVMNSPNLRKYPHFKDDQDWLNNTTFAITKKNKLSKTVKHCNSHPTWPNGMPTKEEVIADNKSI